MVLSFTLEKGIRVFLFFIFKSLYFIPCTIPISPKIQPQILTSTGEVNSEDFHIITDFNPDMEKKRNYDIGDKVQNPISGSSKLNICIRLLSFYFFSSGA